MFNRKMQDCIMCKRYKEKCEELMEKLFYPEIIFEERQKDYETKEIILRFQPLNIDSQICVVECFHVNDPIEYIEHQKENMIRKVGLMYFKRGIEYWRNKRKDNNANI